MISRSLKRCRHGVVRTKGPIVWVSNSTSLRVMFMAAPHRADWCQNSLTRHPFGKVRNTSLIYLSADFSPLSINGSHLHEGCVDLPTQWGQHMIDGFQRAEHHAVL